MTGLDEVIVQRVKHDVNALMKVARTKRKISIDAVKTEIEKSYKKELELAKKRAEGNSSVKAGELHTQFNRWKLSKETEIFSSLRASLIAELEKSPKKLFNKVLKIGKIQFKNPQISVGPELKGLFKGAVVDDDIRGMRIGQRRVYVSAEIPDIVDLYIEKNYSKILKDLFGDTK
ncbi:MAG: hypothetical protein GOV01_03715 [Candidatus Altiarchaeota archaeon]|nr:hypothetical protein [Candidatus Altiarchaeota archaeon]